MRLQEGGSPAWASSLAHARDTRPGGGQGGGGGAGERGGEGGVAEREEGRVHRWPFEKIDGPGKWNKPQPPFKPVPSIFNQTHLKRRAG